MEVVHQRCAGVDVHLRFLVVCLSIVEGGQRRKEIRSFRNETADLLALRAWRVARRMQCGGDGKYGSLLGTGVSAFGGFLRTGRGQCTAYEGSAWPKNRHTGCRLDSRSRGTHGLLTASFVPSQEQQDLRDLTRLRVSLVQERTRLANRVRYPSLTQLGVNCQRCSAIFWVSQENGSYKRCVQEKTIRCV